MRTRIFARSSSRSIVSSSSSCGVGGGDRIQLQAQLQALESGSSRERRTPIWYASVLQLCGKLRALPEGRLVQAALQRSDVKSNIFLSNHLITMYSKCGSLEEARREFDRMQTRNVFSWTAIISAYAHSGRNAIALDMFKRMVQEERFFVPDKVAFAMALNACANLGRLADGRWIHQLAALDEHDSLVGNSIVDMYGKCGNAQEALRAFERIQEKDSLCWTSIIAAHMRSGQAQEAWLQYSRMQLEGCKPDKVTFVTLLSSRSSSRENENSDESSSIGYEQGTLLHSHVADCELESEQGICSGLLRMYSLHGRLKEAKQVFDEMSDRDIDAWNLLVAAAAHKGHSSALRVFRWMQQKKQEVKANKDTFVILLKALSSSSSSTNTNNISRQDALLKGKTIHEAVEKAGLGTDPAVCCALIRMYGSCGSSEDALQVFDITPGRECNTEPWDALLAAYAQQGQGWKAYKLFKWMLFECKRCPGAATFVAMFDACARLGLQEEARIIKLCFEDAAAGSKLQPEGALACSLINMLVKCDMLGQARRLFSTMQDKRQLPAWNSLMGAFLHARHHDSQVIKLFRQILVEGVPRPNKFTYISVLHACARVQSLAQGLAVRECLLTNEAILRDRDEDGLINSALINVYNFCSDKSKRQRRAKKRKTKLSAYQLRLAAVRAFRASYIPMSRKAKRRLNLSNCVL